MTGEYTIHDNKNTNKIIEFCPEYFQRTYIYRVNVTWGNPK